MVGDRHTGPKGMQGNAGDVLKYCILSTFPSHRYALPCSFILLFLGEGGGQEEL